MSKFHLDLYETIDNKRAENMGKFAGNAPTFEYSDNNVYECMMNLSPDLYGHWAAFLGHVILQPDVVFHSVYKKTLMELPSSAISQEMVDLRWLRRAKGVKKNSSCASRQIGATLVKDNVVIGDGWNNTPGDCTLCSDITTECRRRKNGFQSGQGIEMCPAIHAECAAIYDALKHGEDTKGATLYCYCGLPCRICAGVIVHFGISTVVCTNRFNIYDDASPRIFADNNIEIRDISAELV